ncbi:MAG: aminoacyl-tRNA hydrolase [Clostridia bacterium]|nr:aminoacyl-tRNA hydrolase [Clostridia bacterium]
MEPKQIDFIVCGLGNPGSKYEMTRHNVGFCAIDLLAEKLGQGRLKSAKCKALYGVCAVGGKNVLLMKPQTFMNLSGEAVRDMLHAYGLTPEKLLVVFDDADLPAGRIRIRKSGSAGTHNGMRSIIYLLESDQFPRIKVGIGHPGRESGEDLADYVLSPMDSDTWAAVRTVPGAVIDLLEHGVEHAMQEYNNFSPGPAPEEKQDVRKKE